MYTKAGRLVGQVETDVEPNIFDDPNTTDDDESAEESEEGGGDESAEDSEEGGGLMSQAIRMVTPLQITRRRILQGHLRVQRNRHQPPTDGTRRVAQTQRLWQEHALAASELYPRSLWRVLYAVRDESKVTQSHVLAACRKMLPKSQQSLWPKTRKVINEKIKKKTWFFL